MGGMLVLSNTLSQARGSTLLLGSPTEAECMRGLPELSLNCLLIGAALLKTVQSGKGAAQPLLQQLVRSRVGWYVEGGRQDGTFYCRVGSFCLRVGACLCLASGCC